GETPLRAPGSSATPLFVAPAPPSVPTGPFSFVMPTERAEGGGPVGNAREGMKLLWFATGSGDFLLDRAQEAVEVFKKNGYQPVFEQTTGGHTWIHWQKYLNEFAPQLFRYELADTSLRRQRRGSPNGFLRLRFRLVCHPLPEVLSGSC